MDKLIEILSQEESSLLKINDILNQHEQAIIAKDMAKLSLTISELEDALHAFENLEEERKRTFRSLKTGMNLPEQWSLYDFAKSMGGILLEKLFKVTECLNEMAFQIEKLRQLSDFQLRYIDVLIKLLSPQDSSTYDERASLRKDKSHHFEVES